MLTQEKIKELLHYDPITGDVVWIVDRPNQVKAGWKVTSKSKSGHIKIEIGRKKYLLHRIIWLYVYGSFPEHHIDHINGNPSDNRISNLRDVERKVNNENRHSKNSNNSSGITGVDFLKRLNKYRARICSNYNPIHIGMFDTEKEAEEAYIAAKLKLHKGYISG